MKQCERCFFYDMEYDNLLRSGDDIAFVGQEYKEKHYCRLYDHAIDDKIVTDEVKCERYFSKDRK